MLFGELVSGDIGDPNTNPLSLQNRVPCEIPLGQFRRHCQGRGSPQQTGKGANPDVRQVLHDERKVRRILVHKSLEKLKNLPRVGTYYIFVLKDTPKGSIQCTYLTKTAQLKYLTITT